MQNIEQIKADLTKAGYHLQKVSNLAGDDLGYRVTSNNVRVHFERTITAEKVLKIHSRVTK